MRRLLILFAIAAMLTSCSVLDRSGLGRSGDSQEALPPVERLRNTGSYPVQIDAGMGLDGNFSIPLLDGPFPAVVLADDGSLAPDQVKDEARLLARHGFAVLGFSLLEQDPVRQFARAGSTVISQPGVGTSEAALVLLAGDAAVALEAHRRLAGYRVLVIIDPDQAPTLSEFVAMGEPTVAMFQHDVVESIVESWRDGLSLVGARTAVVIDDGIHPDGMLLSPQRREALAEILLEFLQ